MGTQAANILVGAYKTSQDVSAENYALGIREAFQYGLWNAPRQDLNNGPFSSGLTEHQRNVAYENGRIAARQRAAQEQAAKAKQSGQKETGKVHFDGDRSVLSERQRTSLSTLDTIADALGVQIYVFESPVDAQGNRVGKNGWYDPDDGSIHIDLFAGSSGQGTMLFTAAHELTHFIRDQSPAKFQTLADFLMEQYGQKGISLQYLMDEQIRKAKKNGRTIDDGTAYEEVVADSMETMLSDGKVVAKLRQKDKSIWEMVKGYIHDLAEKIRKAYAGLRPDSLEGKLVADMKDAVEKMQELFTEGLVDAGENYQGSMDTESDFYNAGIKYSERVTDKAILSFLYNQETITTYKTMQIVDGKLYPPMAARIEGKHEDYSELGVWEQATEHPELIKGNGKFKLDKGKGQGSIEAAYNPYMHSSNLVLNDQFSGAYNRPNLVTVECVVPVSEVTSGYHAQYAKDSVGWHPWHTGTVAGAIRQAKGIERQVFLSRWIKPVRIVTDAEVASIYKDLLSGTDIAVPDNVVTPSLLQELKKAGVNIEKSGRVKYSFRGYSDDGRGIYESNFPKGTPKQAKSEKVLRYIQNVWSKSPIKLKIKDATGVKYIDARFDPTYDESGNTPTDASKLMGGNRHGTSAEQRVTLDLADDYYKIASESRYNYSKDEIGKTTNPHQNVRRWHYFVNDIYFVEYGSNDLVPYRVSINVKEKEDGNFFYSFSAEKEKESSSQRTLHAAVNSSDAAKRTLYNEIIPQSKRDVNAKLSDRDPSLERMNKALAKENAKLKEDVTELKKLLKLQKSLTHGTLFTKASVESMARVLMKDAGAKGTTAELAGLLNEVYTYIARNEELTWEGVVEKAQPAVDWLQEHMETVQRVDAFGEEVLGELRGSWVYLDEAQK